jgi:hypothetical protein
MIDATEARLKGQYKVYANGMGWDWVLYLDRDGPVPIHIRPF